MKLCECYDSHEYREYNSLCLSDALITYTAIEGIVDIQREHLRFLSRITCCKSEVLIEEFEAVRQCKESTDGDRRAEDRNDNALESLPHEPAPSIIADSIRSCGTDMIPAM